MQLNCYAHPSTISTCLPGSIQLINNVHHGIFDPYPAKTTMTAIKSLPTTAVPSWNYFIAFHMDTSPGTVDYNIENNNSDQPSDDNNDDNVVDCFPCEGKQPVQPQDILPNVPNATNTLPNSLIESTTDTSFDTNNHIYEYRQ